MSEFDDVLRDLVIANRILAHEEVVDAYGHVSVRHPGRPDRFFLSGSRSPELVTLEDIIEYDLDCNPIDQRGRAMYTERPIHGGIFAPAPRRQVGGAQPRLRADPLQRQQGIKLRAMLHTSAAVGQGLPVWDIRDKFGDTNMLVTTMDQGHDLAARLGRERAVLMRGHGCAVAGGTIQDAVHTSVYLKVNAKLQNEAMRFGDITYLSEGEIAQMTKLTQGPDSRAWEYWARRSGAKP